MARTLITLGMAIICHLFVSVAALAQDVAPPPGRGWHIEICTNKSNPARILFKYKFPNAPGDFAGSKQWDRGTPSDIDLPLEFRYAWRVYLWAYSDHQQADFCLRYGNRGVKHWSFDGDPETHNIDQEDSDGDCHC